MKKDRMLLIDVLKILCAGIIFLRHASSMGGCYLYFMDDFAYYATSPIMSLFFIVSGFSLFYIYGERELCSKNELLGFYKKRAISILPMYFFVHIVYSFIFKYDPVVSWNILPATTLGIQSWYDGLFSVSHTGGTWFVSCLLLAYFVYPLLQELINILSAGRRAVFLAVVLLILVYTNHIGGLFSVSSTYSSPLFRGLEFASGALICSFRRDIGKNIKNYISIPMLALTTAALIYCINRQSGIYTDLVFPLLLLLVLCCSLVRTELKEKNILRRIIVYGSSLSYGFYILQLLLWTPFYFFADRLWILTVNHYRLVFAFILLLCMDVTVHELFEKPVQRFLKKKMRTAVKA